MPSSGLTVGLRRGEALAVGARRWRLLGVGRRGACLVCGAVELVLTYGQPRTLDGVVWLALARSAAQIGLNVKAPAGVLVERCADGA